MGMSMPLPTIEGLLEERIGLNPESVGTDTVERAVQRRMEACGTDDPAAYLAHLQVTPGEFDQLVETVVIPETWFFRDDGTFAYLATFASCEWRPGSTGAPLRVLSLACGSGEEPYSIAMTLDMAGVREFEVLGVDVRHSAIDKGRCATYGESSFRGSDLGFRDRFFAECDGGYNLAPTVAQRVGFVVGNALDRTLFEGEAPFNVVFCRNLMIYLTRASRERVADTAYRLLLDDGLLFAGHAETESIWAGRFLSARQPRAFAYVKAVEQKPIRPARAPKSAAASRRRVPKKARHTTRPPAAGRKTTAAPQAPASALSGSKEERLENARKLADAGRFDEATDLCEQHLDEVGTSAEALFLLGMVSQAQGKEMRAEELFHKVTYLEPNHYEALMCLALQREKRGDLDGAGVLRRRAERAFVKSQDEHGGDDGAPRADL
jgi:chemotaxis protein methyltransferase WspC